MERLAFAWVRRKKFEAKLIATEVLTPFAKRQQSGTVSPEEMWAEIEGL